MSEIIKILYIDDDPMDRALVRDALEKEHSGFELTEAVSQIEFEKLISEQTFDLVLTDFNILGYEGLQVIDFIKSNYPEIPVIVVTGTGSEEIAVEAMKRSSSDYIIKSPHHIKKLPESIKKAIKANILELEKKRTENELARSQEELRELNKALEIQNKELIENFKKIQQINSELQKSKEKAEQSDRLKSAFLSNMSHEIRSPMNGILGFLNLLSKPDLDSEKRASYIEIVNTSGARLLNTINDIIEISEIEAGTVIINQSVINLSELLQEQYRFFDLKAKEKGLSFTLKLPEIDISIKSDKSKLESITTNLINNAIKFTENGSIEVGLQKNNDVILLYFKDTGCGIKPENIKSVF